MWIRSPCKKFEILHQSLQVSQPSRWDCISPCIDLWRLFDKLDLYVKMFEPPCSIPKWNRRWVWLCRVGILNNVSFWRIRSQNVNIWKTTCIEIFDKISRNIIVFLKSMLQGVFIYFLHFSMCLYKRGQKLYIFCVLIFSMRRVQYCHTRHYLAISAQLKIWQVSACKWGLRRGIIISQPSTRSSTLKLNI